MLKKLFNSMEPKLVLLAYGLFLLYGYIFKKTIPAFNEILLSLVVLGLLSLLFSEYVLSHFTIKKQIYLFILGFGSYWLLIGVATFLKFNIMSNLKDEFINSLIFAGLTIIGSYLLEAYYGVAE